MDRIFSAIEDIANGDSMAKEEPGLKTSEDDRATAQFVIDGFRQQYPDYSDNQIMDLIAQLKEKEGQEMRVRQIQKVSIPVLINSEGSWYDQDENVISISGESANEMKVNVLKDVVDCHTMVSVDEGERVVQVLRSAIPREKWSEVVHFQAEQYGKNQSYIFLSNDVADIALSSQDVISSLPRKAKFDLNRSKDLRIRTKWGEQKGRNRTFDERALSSMIQELISQVNGVDSLEEMNRSDIHEKAHYVDASIRTRGAGKLITYLERMTKHINNLKTTEKRKLEKQEIDLLRNGVEISGLMEAEATLHEVLQQQYIKSADNFSFQSFSYRLLGLLALCKVIPNSDTTFLERDIDTSRDEEKTHLLEVHDIGTLVLIFGNKIFSGNNNSIDLELLLTPEERASLSSADKNSLIAGIIIERVEDVISDPIQLATEWIATDIKSQIDKKLDESRLKSIQQIRSLGKTDSRYLMSEITPESLHYIQRSIELNYVNDWQPEIARDL